MYIFLEILLIGCHIVLCLPSPGNLGKAGIVHASRLQADQGCAFDWRVVFSVNDEEVARISLHQNWKIVQWLFYFVLNAWNKVSSGFRDQILSGSYYQIVLQWFVITLFFERQRYISTCKTKNDFVDTTILLWKAWHETIFYVDRFFLQCLILPC